MSDRDTSTAIKRDNPGGVRLATLLMLLAAGLVILVSMASFIVSYTDLKRCILSELDEKLLVAADAAREMLPPDYHDRIINAGSVTDEQYHKIVEDYDRFCLRHGLEFVWSMMEIDDAVRFTSGTSPSKAAHEGHAHFFDKYPDPEEVARAFQTMEVQCTQITDHWGKRRGVLVPRLDSKGRKYLFGASLKLDDVDALLHRRFMAGLSSSLVLCAIAVAAGLGLARLVSRPTAALTEGAQAVSRGDFDHTIPIRGVYETRVLADSFNQMNLALAAKVAALRESERRLVAAQRIAKMGDFTWNVNSGQVVWSDALFELLRYDKSESVDYAQVNAEIHHPDDRERVTQWLNDCVASGEGELPPNEYRVIRRDGEVISVRTQGVIQREADGSIKVFATVRDVTERRHAEEALRDSSERLRLALQASLMGTWEWDIANDCVMWSPETLSIFGVSEEEFEGTYEAFLRFVAPESLTEIDGHVTEFVSKAQESDILQFEHRIIRGDGRTGWIEVRGAVTADENGRPVRMTGICADVTERKAAQASLLAEKQLSEDYINSLPGLFYVFDESRFVRWNKAWHAVTGYSDEELSDKYGPDFFEGDDKALIERRMSNVFREGADVAEAELVTKDGRKIPYFFTGRRRYVGGKPHLVGLGIDITDRRRAEEVRGELEAQLRQSQKLEAVGQLAGGVAHDFNNILTAILGNVELGMDSVRGQLRADHKLIGSMEQIEKAAQRASALTRQLLTFSRRDIAQPEILSINQILIGLDKMLRRLITEDITLETVADPELRPVEADAGQLEQVIVNLVVNAVHAMPDGGRLTLETQNVILDDSYVSMHAEARPGPHVLLGVSDTGHGMDSATRERIFEPFFTTKAVDKGTGLGLATVHGIVKQSGGHINVYSELGRGTTFKVYLPATDAPVGKQSTPKSVAAPRGNETILLCEDDHPVRGLIAISLRSAGYTVITADSGESGAKAAGETPGRIDLLITDVIMPDINGRVLSERLRKTRRDLKTLFISGYTSNVIAHHGVLDQGVEFLEKPFTRLALLTKVRAVLDKTPADA